MVCTMCFHEDKTAPPPLVGKLKAWQGLANHTPFSVVARMAGEETGEVNFPKMTVLVHQARGLTDDAKNVFVEVEVGHSGDHSQTLSTKSRTKSNYIKVATAAASNTAADPTWALGSDGGKAGIFTIGGATEKLVLEGNMVVRVNVWRKRKMHANVLLGQWESDVVSLVDSRRRGAHWYGLSSPVDAATPTRNAGEMGGRGGVDSTGSGPVGDVQLSFQFTGSSRLLRGFTSQIVSAGCGTPQAVMQLISTVEAQLPIVTSKLYEADEAIECLANHVERDDFTPRECTVPDPSDFRQSVSSSRTTPRVGVEGNLRDAVYGGIFSVDGPSTTLYEDWVPAPTQGAAVDVDNESWLQGPAYTNHLLRSQRE